MILGSVLVNQGSFVQAQTTSSDSTQYEWPQYGCDDGQTGFNPGAAPSTANIVFKVPAGSSQVQVFNGKAFIASGTSLTAYDAYTGSTLWEATLKSGASGFGTTSVSKIDDTYMFVNCGGPEVHRISDGEYVANLSLAPYYGRMPGSGQYFYGAYSSELKMEYVTTYDDRTSEGKVVAISLADPTQPKIEWEYVANEASEILSTGGGKVYLGTTQAAVYALDGSDGTFLWRTHKTGLPQQSALYYNGKVYSSAVSQYMSCINAENGEIEWEYDSSVLGTRAYYAYKGAAAYGRIYDCPISVDPNGWVVCWDAETGDLLWKQPAYYNIAYNTVAVADGKVYASKCDQPSGRATAGLEMPGYAFTCFDAFTGTQLWSIEGLNVANPTIAYGNVYAATGGYLYCIGDSAAADPWAFGFSGNLDTPRVAIGQTGPSDLSYPKWVYQTEGEVGSSPAIIDGKVYIGSHDQNWYCLNAYTGEKIWNFSTDFRVMSSAAVVGGRVYTGSDDGKFYCLDANTGDKVWEHNAGGLITNVIFPVEWQPRSSPIIIGDKLYCGSLDGKVYCLNIADGSEAWTYATNGPIGGSPAYSNGVIYITSTDSYMYALNANNGNLLWKSFPLNPGVGIPIYCDMWCAGTPNVANGIVYVGGGSIYGFAVSDYDYTGKNQTRPNGSMGGGILMFAFDATTGQSIWNQSLAGNSQAFFIPTYYEGTLYISEFMHVTAMNATYPTSGSIAIVGFGGDRPGNRTWKQWIGYQILSSALYVDDVRGPKVYISSDVGSVTCIDAITGLALSSYQTKSNVDSSPAVWDGKLYVGSSDGCVYCFDDSPAVDFTLYAESNKGEEMWNNETLSIRGQLTANPMQLTWNNGSYVSVASDMHPGLPDATVELCLTEPDGSEEALTATTDNTGYFSFSVNPTDVGVWGWVVYYNGVNATGLTYNKANGQWNELTVLLAPTGQSQTPQATATPPATTAAPETTPTTEPTTDDGLPMEYIYVAIAVIVVVIVVVAAYTYTKRKT
ncbi:MAG: PQQ-binding-like beta-propeller repeat protein [Candidatus Bathyarchaeota archaeon]|nr:PQQ-binding-like beta-propeller repeat protein [Candidatus Bathyarchaeota archaeon]